MMTHCKKVTLKSSMMRLKSLAMCSWEALYPRFKTI